ncbi:hypothetical protein ACFL6E_01850 [Candidatus Neomarinimicrobiota bacterium]
MVSYRSPLLIGFLLTLSILTAKDFEQADYNAAALKATLACLSSAPLPAEGSPITVSMHPAFITTDITRNPGSKNLMPALEVLWSVSPNLDILGGLGMANIAGDLIRWQRWGLSFLAETLELAGFVPRFNFLQGGLSGFASYNTKWNQTDWIYNRKFGSWRAHVGITMLFHTVFLQGTDIAEGISRRTEINKNFLYLGGGYDIFSWLTLDGFGIFGKAGSTTGLQISLAL